VGSTGLARQEDLNNTRRLRPGSQLNQTTNLADQQKWKGLINVLQSDPQLLVKMLPSPKNDSTKHKQTGVRKFSREKIKKPKSGKQSVIGNYSKQTSSHSSEQKLHRIINQATFKIKGQHVPQLTELCNCKLHQFKGTQSPDPNSSHQMDGTVNPIG